MIVSADTQRSERSKLFYPFFIENHHQSPWPINGCHKLDKHMQQKQRKKKNKKKKIINWKQQDIDRENP